MIIDDGSTDLTKEVSCDFIKRDSRFHYYYQANAGLSSARNKGIKNSTGKWLIFLDSDDLLYKDCLKSYARVILKSEESTLLQCAYTYLSQDAVRCMHTTVPVNYGSLIPAIFKNNLGPPVSFCVSKEIVNKIGFFDEELRSVEDWDFWIRIAKLGASYQTISDPLVYYRYVDNSMSRNAFVMYEALKTVINRIPKKDNRIKSYSLFNRDHFYDIDPLLDEVLIRSVGVSIMQGKVDESVMFFLKNLKLSINKLEPSQMENMCSYLSFRYRTEMSEMKWVLSVLPDFYEVFFNKAGFSKRFTKVALKFIFKRHQQLSRINKYGFVGRILNFLLN